MQRDHIIDPWTPLDFKPVFGNQSIAGGPGNAPWLNRRDRRRLSAYMVLSSYAQNAARHLYGSEDDAERREYGDASLIIEQALSALMGESQDIVVPEAADFDPDAARDDAAPADDAEAANQSDAAQQAEAADAYTMQDRLREWWDQENVALTVLDGERKAVTLGDCVYLVWWDPAKQRPRLSVIDPGFYFPVLPTGLVGDKYPTRVHFLWSTPADEDPTEKETLTRVTYDLRPIAPVVPAVEFIGRTLTEAVLRPGDRWEATGDGGRRIVRDVPWSDEPVAETCYLTEATWELSALGSVEGGVDGLDMSKAIRFGTREDGAGGMDILRDFDLGIDFLPVVHIPNTVPGEDHFGQALLSKAAQNLDDLQSADTDSQAAAATTGSPMIGMTTAHPTTVVDKRSGQRVPEAISIAPGKVFQLSPDGKLFTVDTSANLREMRAYVTDLWKRLTRNARLPEVALSGRPEGSGEVSGIALRLQYGPMEGLIRGMRLPRSAKYPVLLRFVQRMFMLADEYDGPTATFDADLVYGSFIPQDQAGAVTAAAEAYSKGVISLATAVTWLVNAGVPIEDAVAEVEAIESRDYKRAGELMDAINDPAAARALLGLAPVPTAQGTPLPAGSTTTTT